MAGLDIVQRSSMIVDNLDIGRSGRAVAPIEADSPDTDAVLARAIGLQCFQPIAPECLQLIEAHRCVERRNFASYTTVEGDRSLRGTGID